MVFSVTLESVLQASHETCWKVFSVDVCSCLFMNFYILGGEEGYRNGAELNPRDFFLVHWLPPLSICPLSGLSHSLASCILSCALAPLDEFGIHIGGSVITLAGFEISQGEICLWLYSM